MFQTLDGLCRSRDIVRVLHGLHDLLYLSHNQSVSVPLGVKLFGLGREVGAHLGKQLGEEVVGIAVLQFRDLNDALDAVGGFCGVLLGGGKPTYRLPWSMKRCPARSAG